MAELIFGTREIGGEPSYKNISEKKAHDILSYAFEKGIRYFDTAPIYGNGKSEKLLGKYLHEVRKEIKIITKFGFGFDKNGKTFFDFSSQGIHEQIHMSLERLKTDYIDIYLLHIPNNTLDIDEIIHTLNILKKKGLIHTYGLCNTYSQMLQNFIQHPDSHIDYVQDFYNIIEKKAESLIFPYLHETCEFMAYSPFYRGLLTSTGVKELLLRNEEAINRLIRHNDLPLLIKQKKLYEEIAKIKGVSIEQIAIDFLKSHKKVNHILFGTTNKEHLDTILNLIK